MKHARILSVLHGRRRFLSLSGGAALTAIAANAQAQTPAPSAPARRIDVHHHMLPPKYIAVARDRLLSFAPSFASVLDWTPAQSVEQMDKFGIATAIVSLSNPGAWFGDANEARGLARMSNEFAADMIRDHPGRFGLFAALSLPDVDGSLREIEHSLDTLKADGIGMLTSYGDKWPGDPSFAPMWEELNRRKAVVYFHPTSATCCSALIPDIPAPAVEYMFDTTRAIASLLFSGTFSKCPDVRFIFSHAGGATAPIVERIVRLATIDKKILARLPNGPLAELKRLYFDTATSTGPENLGAILRLSGSRQILLGTDYPFLPIATTINGLDRFGFSAEDKARVDSGNAEDLFP